MKIVQASKKPMVQGFRKGNDLKRIIFSNKGDKFISIDRTYGIKLWDTKKQTLLRQFNQLIAHHAIFTPNDQNIILIGKQIIHFYQTSNTKQIYRLTNGINMGTGDCSPNNLYFAYTNASQIFIRDIATKTLLNHTSNSLCEPYFASFNPNSNYLYTSSLNTGKLCKWDVQNFYPTHNLTLGSNVADIDFTDNLLIVSSDRNRRRIFFLSLQNLQNQGSRTLPKSFFLDFNTQIHSTYNKYKDIIISIAVPGQYLFYHNATTLKYLGSQQVNLNTYTITFNNVFYFLGLGGQVSNRQLKRVEDQILYYIFPQNCSNIINTQLSEGSMAICKCKQQYFWNKTLQSCEKQTCQKIINNQCSCLINQRLNNYTQNCQLNCSSIQNSFQAHQIQNACPCIDNYRWNQKLNKCIQFDCSLIKSSTGVLKTINECQCYEKFYFNHQKFQCRINCTNIKFTINQAVNQYNKCTCSLGYVWNQEFLYCEKFEEKEPNPTPSPQPQPQPRPPILQSSGNQIPIIAIIIPIIMVALCCILIIIVIICWKKRKNKQKDHMSDIHSNLPISSKQSEHQQDRQKQTERGFNIQESKNKQKKLQNIEGQLFCDICFNEKPDRISNCRHYFHQQCILKQLKKKDQCPSCQQKQIKLYDIIELDQIFAIDENELESNKTSN